MYSSRYMIAVVIVDDMVVLKEIGAVAHGLVDKGCRVMLFGA